MGLWLKDGEEGKWFLCSFPLIETVSLLFALSFYVLLFIPVTLVVFFHIEEPWYKD